MLIDFNATAYTTSHLLYDGQGGWIEAKAVTQECWDEPGWEFKNAYDCVRWLRA